MRWLILACCAAIGLGIGLTLLPDEHSRHGESRSEAVGIAIPDLTGAAAEGREVFAQNCAACHGPHATGSETGPPLVHKIYEPSHHGDASFLLAVRNGVRAHHWSYGNMPPIPDISETEVGSVIAYVRTLQRANGIH